MISSRNARIDARGLRAPMAALAGVILVVPATVGQAGVWSYQTIQVTDNDVQDGPPSDINAWGDIVWVQQQAPGSDFYDVWLWADGMPIRVTDTADWSEWSPRVNNAGSICYGRTENPAAPHYFSEVWLYTAAGGQKISPPPPFPEESHWGPEINNLGEVVWHVSDSFSAPTRIYLYSDGVATDISDLTQATDQSSPQINDSTSVVSQGASISTGSVEIFLYVDGDTGPITSNGYSDSNAVVNALGQIAWVKQESGAAQEIMLWDAGVTTQLTDDDVADLFPVIADNGAMAWSKAYGGNDDIWAYFPGDGVIEITDTPEAEWAPSINARNEIVYVRWADENNEVFVWADGLERRLTDNDVSDTNAIIGDSGVIAWRRDDGNDTEIMVAYPCLHGDRDCDGDIDVDDYVFFAGCMTGPGDPANPGGSLPPGCEAFDFEPDVDVDLEDFGLFQRAFGTPP